MIAKVLTLFEVVSRKALCMFSFSAKHNWSLPISSLKWTIMLSLFPSKFFKVWTSDTSLVFSISVFFKCTCNSSRKYQEYYFWFHDLSQTTQNLKYHYLSLIQKWSMEGLGVRSKFCTQEKRAFLSLPTPHNFYVFFLISKHCSFDLMILDSLLKCQ